MDPKRSRQTFATFVQGYEKRSRKRETTKARDRAVIRRWLLPHLGPTPIGAITPEAVQDLVDDMDAELAPASVRTNYGVLRAILANAVQRRIIGWSPCRGIDLPKSRRAEPRFLTMDELHDLGEAMPVDYCAAVYVAAIVGLRWSELAGLRVGRLDFLRRTLTVAETLAEVEGRLVFDEPKTESSRRTIGVPAEVMNILAEHLARRGRPGPEELVFVSPEGEPLRASHFRRRVWAPAVKSAGLVEGLTFDGLRHSAVRYMIELGAHPRVIQQRMGHASVRTTLDVYGRVYCPPSMTPSPRDSGTYCRAPAASPRPRAMRSRSTPTPKTPACLRKHRVELMGLEPTTPCLQSRCSSQLSYSPEGGPA